MFAIINHDIFDTNNNVTFSFKVSDHKKIGEVVLCHTRKGDRIGRIVEMTDKLNFTPKAKAVRATKATMANLSSYDLALVSLYRSGKTNITALTEKELEKVLKNFNGYSDHRALEAFCYNNGADYVEFFSVYGGDKNIRIYSDYFEGIFMDYCFG